MGLLKFINENGNARKIFGKRELRIIEKQLLGVNLTQSEKNRLSRDIRKKFEFIGEVSGFKGEFKLKKGVEIKNMIEEAKQFILEDSLFKRIEEIILYGSVMENKLTLKSDIDIVVKFDNISLKEATLFRKRISGKVDKKVDVQVYNCLPKKIKMEINKRIHKKHSTFNLILLHFNSKQKNSCESHRNCLTFNSLNNLLK